MKNTLAKPLTSYSLSDKQKPKKPYAPPSIVSSPSAVVKAARAIVAKAFASRPKTEQPAKAPAQKKPRS